MLAKILAVIKVTVYYNKQLLVRLVVNDISDERVSFIFCLAIGFIRSELFKRKANYLSKDQYLSLKFTS
jgi:hypothetical protein